MESRPLEPSLYPHDEQAQYTRPFPTSPGLPTPYPYYPPLSGQRIPTPTTSTSAIVSLVCSISSWIMLPLIGAALGVVFGHIARREIRRSAGTITGNGLAIAGLVIGYANLVVMILALLLLAFIAVVIFTSGATTI